MGTHLDVLVIENFLLIKEQQDKSKLKNYKKKFELGLNLLSIRITTFVE